MTARACGECAVCCTLLGVNELGKAGRTPCLHQRGIGCAIYETRPSSCQTFNCGWLLGLLRHDDRPDHLGVMLTGTSDDNPLRKLGVNPVLVIETVAGGLERAKAPLVRLSRERVLVLLSVDGQERVVGPRREMRAVARWDARARRAAEGVQ